MREQSSCRTRVLYAASLVAQDTLHWPHLKPSPVLLGLRVGPWGHLLVSPWWTIFWRLRRVADHVFPFGRFFPFRMLWITEVVRPAAASCSACGCQQDAIR